MNIIACVDDNLGMMFNQRRQSKDRLLISKILEYTNGKKVWVNDYSSALFAECNNSNVNVSDSFLSEAEDGEYCFVENVSLKKYERWIEKIIIFRWNRNYPGDVFFDIPLNEDKWRITATEEFAGSSHEKITMEVYER